MKNYNIDLLETKGVVFFSFLFYQEMYCSLEQFCNDPNPNPKNSGRSPNLFLEVQGIFFIKTHIYSL